ncbi:hypothetical protein BD779DRAFT_1671819 [Infundibulicybe gibba]|nr:hypothetical protein BD779DRAFT_1671819 [Infundibulicybe gibba]
MANGTGSKRKAVDVVDDPSGDESGVPPASQVTVEEGQRPSRESKTKLYKNPPWERKTTPAPRSNPPPAKKMKPSSKNGVKPKAPPESQGRPRHYKAAAINDESDGDPTDAPQRVRSESTELPPSQPHPIDDEGPSDEETVFETRQEEEAAAEERYDIEANNPESEDEVLLNMNKKELETQFAFERSAWSGQRSQSVSQSPTITTPAFATPDTTDGTPISSRRTESAEPTAIIHDLDTDDEDILPKLGHRKGKDKALPPPASNLDAELMAEFMRFRELKNANLAGTNHTANKSKPALLTTPKLSAVEAKSAPRPKPKPKIGSRQLKHELERPSWSNPACALPGNSGSQPPPAQPPARSMMQSLIIKSEQSEYQIHQFAEWTNLRYHPDDASQSKLLLNSQEPRIKETVTLSFMFLWGFYCWNNAFPDINLNIEFLRKSLLKAAKNLKYDDLTTRLLTDVEYNAALSTLPNARVSAWRTNPKKDASSAIVSSYTITRLNPLRTGAWLQEFAYIYPGDVGDAENSVEHSLDGSRPYEHPTILAVLEQVYFTGLSSIGARLVNKFKSSRKDRPEEKEVPVAMLALVATGVYAAIKEWETGKRIKSDFGGKVFEATYQRHVEFLGIIMEKGPNKFHAMMHRIYLRASNHALASPEVSAPISSLLKIDMMPED